jgi:predicted lipoprotein with Yx(FWY)xxD motif
VEYSGYLLYTFIKDTAPGQVTGQGVGKVWYIATPDINSYVIRVTKGTVAGKAEMIFTNAQGFPLYYYTPDAPTKLACSGGCAKAWPPLLAASGSGTPLADAPLTGTLTVFNNANGSQVEYNGHLLYSFQKDSEGVVTGQGVGGKWFIATPTLKAA